MFFATPPLHNPKAAPSWVLVFTAVAVPSLGMAFGPAKSLAVQFDTGVPAAIVLETVSPIVAAHADNRNGNGESDMGLATQGTHPGSCAIVHGLRTYVGMDLSPKELTRDVAEAVAMADIATLAELVILAPVRMFAERNAIQILDCDGETIAGHVPVAPGLMQSLQTAVQLAEDAQQ